MRLFWTIPSDFLRAAILVDVQVHLRVYQGLPHVWQLFTGMLDEGQAALEEAGAFFRQASGQVAANGRPLL